VEDPRELVYVSEESIALSDQHGSSRLALLAQTFKLIKIY